MDGGSERRRQRAQEDNALERGAGLCATGNGMWAVTGMFGEVFITKSQRTHANKPRNEHTNADTKAHTKAHTSTDQPTNQPHTQPTNQPPPRSLTRSAPELVGMAALLAAFGAVPVGLFG